MAQGQKINILRQKYSKITIKTNKDKKYIYSKTMSKIKYEKNMSENHYRKSIPKRYLNFLVH